TSASNWMKERASREAFFGTLRFRRTTGSSSLSDSGSAGGAGGSSSSDSIRRRYAGLGGRRTV
ncbi:hypothetical protein NL529_34245, partial [Klebsiella pneumoniae]|nr:hypothetical protein [Klebsiella pneumoniae]